MHIFRVLISPLVYLLYFVGLFLIMAGPIFLLSGIAVYIRNRMKKRPGMSQSKTNTTIFDWFDIPYIEAQKWIKTGVL